MRASLVVVIEDPLEGSGLTGGSSRRETPLVHRKVYIPYDELVSKSFDDQEPTLMLDKGGFGEYNIASLH